MRISRNRGIRNRLVTRRGFSQLGLPNWRAKEVKSCAQFRLDRDRRVERRSCPGNFELSASREVKR